MIEAKRIVSDNIYLKMVDLECGFQINALALTKQEAIELSNALYLALNGDPNPRIGG